MTNIFTSIPASGAIERDWTDKVLTVDIENSLGETYHFEVKPGEKSDKLPSAPSSASPDKKRGNFISAIMPIAV